MLTHLTDFPDRFSPMLVKELRQGLRALTSWARPLDLSYNADEIPWCGLFTCHCLTATLPDEPVPSQPLAARNWQGFGQAVMPQFGAVLVFWRGNKQGWSGHVGYYWGEDDIHYHVLGGNQSDQVNITRVAKSRLLAARWPLSVPPSGTLCAASPSAAPAYP